jgi:hypothetical protein
MLYPPEVDVNLESTAIIGTLRPLYLKEASIPTAMNAEYTLIYHYYL